MKAKIYIVFTSLVMAFVSCNQEEKPKVIYPTEETEKSLDSTDTKEDNKKADDIRIADLPIVMGESEYLMHPIGEVRVYGSGSKFGSKSSNYSYSYTISNFAPYELTGFLTNIMFQHKDSLEIRPLTDAKLQIYTATYLKSIADKHKKHFIIYKVFDQDTNKDGKIDSSDIVTLYLSEGSGKKFRKLTADLQELLDWTVIDSQHRLYFRTIEDVNKNGAFDKDDTINYYYINLLDPKLEIINYNPLQVTIPVATIDGEEK